MSRDSETNEQPSIGLETEKIIMTSDGKGNQVSDDEEDPFRDIEANTSTSVMEELVASKPTLQSSIIILDPDSIRNKAPRPLQLVAHSPHTPSAPKVVKKPAEDPEITIVSERLNASLEVPSLPATPVEAADQKIMCPKSMLGSLLSHKSVVPKKRFRPEVLSPVASPQVAAPVATTATNLNESRPLVSFTGVQNGPRPSASHRPSVKLLPTNVMTGKTVPLAFNGSRDSNLYDHPLLQANTFVIDTPSLVVPFVFEQPPEKSILEFYLENNWEWAGRSNQACMESVPTSLESPLGRFVIDLGLELVMNNLQTKTLNELAEKSSSSQTVEEKNLICELEKAVADSSDLTKVFHHKMHKCRRCDFESESEIAVDSHERMPHFESGAFQCPYCHFKTKSPNETLFHIKIVHNVAAKLWVPFLDYQCCNCSFEASTRKKLVGHMMGCTYAPLVTPIEDIPGKLTKPNSRCWFMDYLEYWQRKDYAQRLGPLAPIRREAPHVVRLGPRQLQVPARFNFQRYPVPRRMIHPQRMQVARPSFPPNCVITIDDDEGEGDESDIDNENVPTTIPSTKILKNYPTDGSILICELCDCFFRDFNVFRDHMLIIHRDPSFSGKAHLNPSLECLKCSSKFFTGSGLERHLLAGHNLVTTFWTERMKFSQDGGRCMECGKVFHHHIVAHYKQIHNRQLTEFKITYKCKICSSKFGIFDLYVRHHSKYHK